jgi:WD40 repeat protein
LVFVVHAQSSLEMSNHLIEHISDVYSRAAEAYINGTALSLDGHNASVQAVAFSPDGAQVVSCSNDYTIRLWHVRTGQQLAVLSGHTSDVESVAYSPNGNYIASGSGDISVRLWNASTGQEIVVLNGHTGWVWSVAFRMIAESLYQGLPTILFDHGT